MTIPNSILNADSVRLLQTVFGDKWTEVWVCWTSNMKGKHVKRLVEGDLPQTEDCYFCIALMPEGCVDRKLIFASRVYALVLDDIGTKISKEAADLFAPPPTWIIETSAGNFQYGYAIKGGMKVREYQELRSAMKSHPIWGKSDGIDAVHLFRLPQGVNTKYGRAVS